jgi:hypothetical protein
MATKPKKKRARLGDTVSSAPIIRDRSGLGALLLPPAENWTWTIADEAVIDAKSEKLVRGLMPAYGINPADPNSWMQLAIRLADEYHPGFRVIDRKLRGRGAPRKDCAAMENFLAVQAKLAEGMTVVAACDVLDRKRAASRRTRYYEQRRKLRSAQGPRGHSA